MNKLYFGDNLTIMREMEDGFVDLIATDPPFNSGRNYNAFFLESKAQYIIVKSIIICTLLRRFISPRLRGDKGGSAFGCPLNCGFYYNPSCYLCTKSSVDNIGGGKQ